MMGFANCQSFEKLVIDNNICGMALRLVKGIECNQETIALDIIKSSGRGAKGHLSSSHTMKWFRKEMYFPSHVINRRAVREGVRPSTTWERAKEEVKSRLEKFEPVQIPEDKSKEVKKIMKTYAKSKGLDNLPNFS